MAGDAPCHALTDAAGTAQPISKRAVARRRMWATIVEKVPGCHKETGKTRAVWVNQPSPRPLKSGVAFNFTGGPAHSSGR
jgi:hypothetical protein